MAKHWMIGSGIVSSLNFRHLSYSHLFDPQIMPRWIQTWCKWRWWCYEDESMNMKRFNNKILLEETCFKLLDDGGGQILYCIKLRRCLHGLKTIKSHRFWWIKSGWRWGQQFRWTGSFTTTLLSLRSSSLLLLLFLPLSLFSLTSFHFFPLLKPCLKRLGEETSPDFPALLLSPPFTIPLVLQSFGQVFFSQVPSSKRPAKEQKSEERERGRKGTGNLRRGLNKPSFLCLSPGFPSLSLLFLPSLTTRARFEPSPNFQYAALLSIHEKWHSYES